MIKGKDLVGRSVVSLSSGHQIDKVHDLVFDHDANQVLALLVDEGGWFRAAKVVPFEAVRSIGEDAVMIDDENSVISARDDSRIADLLDTKVGLVGTRLLTSGGRELGKIADVYFEPTSGKVVGYEATGGLFSDLSSGRTFVPAPESISIGDNAAIVPESVAAAMEEQEAGGLQGALSNVSDNVKQSYENLSTATKSRQKEFVIGKQAGSEVATEEGLVIVQKGETITTEQADHAEELGLLGSLVGAATGGSMQAAYSSAASNVQGRVDDLSDASQERQMQYVIGKTAGKDVVAGGTPTEGAALSTVIVSKGEVITEQQAESAREHGVLGQLVAAATSGSMQTVYSSASSNLQSRVEDLSSASRERQVEYVLGKVAGSDVHGDDDTVIVLKGQTITPMAVQSAESKNALGSLVASATAGNLQGGVQRLSGSYVSSQTADSAPVTGAPVVGAPAASALGRRVRRDVYGPNRTLIAAQGQIVTQGVLERARELHREDDLLDATGIAQVSGTESGGPAIGEQLSAGLSNVSAGATGFFDRAKQWLGETRDNAGEAVEQRQNDAEVQKVRDALGRPVTRVILDPQDNIILNIGEIITNKAVAAARQADILDMLLDSVSKEEVRINPLDVRPHETGSAALEGVDDVNLQKKPQS
ncbi:photosystem reaction center subunit H [Deinococcus psychrotolerans]|uniref:Photosystem reaction center subunit H n=1 Tax=Deinococcus psychrotolerans TaxID=2489213 RepID=A0A3G8YLX6_9DEIO|nr:PRC-barrel domain-containing protein [Deinococcus psychrotolerans]AZI42631.1 photosystem reaction center subunit H [Deinococcus psychrotolerans]